MIISVQDVRGIQTPVLTIGLHLCVPQCNNDYVPVCGSNGESYQNECYLRQAACKQQSEILVVSEGSCATGVYVILKIPWNLLNGFWIESHALQFLLCYLQINNSDYILARQASYSFIQSMHYSYSTCFTFQITSGRKRKSTIKKLVDFNTHVI